MVGEIGTSHIYHTIAVTFSCYYFLDSPPFNLRNLGLLNSGGQSSVPAEAVPQAYACFPETIFNSFVDIKFSKFS
jgi:hypothetical protein